MLIAVTASLVLLIASRLGDGSDKLAHLDRYGLVIKAVVGTVTVVGGLALWLVILSALTTVAVYCSVGGLNAIFVTKRWATLSNSPGSSSASNRGWRADDRGASGDVKDPGGEDGGDDD